MKKAIITIGLGLMGVLAYGQNTNESQSGVIVGQFKSNNSPDVTIYLVRSNSDGSIYETAPNIEKLPIGLPVTFEFADGDTKETDKRTVTID